MPGAAHEPGRSPARLGIRVRSRYVPNAQTGAVIAPGAVRSMTLPVRILGIDPGLRRTGWGVVTATGTKLAYVDCGVVTSDGDLPLALRLRELYEGITRVVEAFQPDEVSVEETFVNKDAQA